MLSKIYGIQAKKATGIGLTQAEFQLLSSYPSLRGEVDDMLKNQLGQVVLRPIYLFAPLFLRIFGSDSAYFLPVLWT